MSNCDANLIPNFQFQIPNCLAAGLIDDEALWLEMLAARNDVAHSYDEAIALKIITACKEKFIALFEALKETLADNWS